MIQMSRDYNVSLDLLPIVETTDIRHLFISLQLIISDNLYCNCGPNIIVTLK